MPAPSQRPVNPNFHLANAAAPPPPPVNSGWGIDKRVSIVVVMTLIASLLGYGGTIIWYLADQAAHMVEQVNRTISNERRIEELEKQIERNMHESRLNRQNILDKIGAINEKMARIEERILYLLERPQAPPTVPAVTSPIARPNR